MTAVVSLVNQKEDANNYNFKVLRVWIVLFCFILLVVIFFLYSFFQCLPNPPVCFQAGARFSVEGASQMPFPQAHKTLR